MICLNIKIYRYFCSNLKTLSNFQPLEVVRRGSETQLQVAKNLNKLTGEGLKIVQFHQKVFVVKLLDLRNWVSFQGCKIMH